MNIFPNISNDIPNGGGDNQNEFKDLLGLMCAVLMLEESHIQSSSKITFQSKQEKIRRKKKMQMILLINFLNIFFY